MKEKKKFYKLIAIILTIVMSFSVMSLAAFADEPTTEGTATEVQKDEEMVDILLRFKELIERFINGVKKVIEEIRNFLGSVKDITKVKVDSISFPNEATVLKVGDTERLVPTILPEKATNKNVTYSSSDESVATVDENGVVTAVGTGTATITATTEDGGKTAAKHIVVGDIVVKENESIYDAYLDAEEGQVIAVAPGVYKERLVISKRVSFLGANAGISANTQRGAETVLTFDESHITGSSVTLVNNSASGVVFDGFYFYDGGYASPSQLVRAMYAHGSDLQIKNNVFDGFNYVQLYVSSAVYNYSNGTWDYHSEYVNNLLLENNLFKDSPSSYYNVQLQGVSCTIRGNVVDNASGIIIQPYHNAGGGLVENNIVNTFVLGFWHNTAYLGSGKWEYKNNVINAVAVPENMTTPPTTYVRWESFLIQSFGVGGAWNTGAAPEVVYENNVVDATNASPELISYGVNFIAPVTNDAKAIFTNNTFAGVQIGVDRKAGALDFNEMLANNAFPEGSAVIGNQIKIAE